MTVNPLRNQRSNYIIKTLTESMSVYSLSVPVSRFRIDNECHSEPFKSAAENRTCWNSPSSLKPSSVTYCSSNPISYFPLIFLFAPKTHTEVPLKAREAEATGVVVYLHVPLWSYLNPRTVRIRDSPTDEGEWRESDSDWITHDCQEGSVVFPSNHASAGV